MCGYQISIIITHSVFYYKNEKKKVLKEEDG